MLINMYTCVYKFGCFMHKRKCTRDYNLSNVSGEITISAQFLAVMLTVKELKNVKGSNVCIKGLNMI